MIRKGYKITCAVLAFLLATAIFAATDFGGLLRAGAASGDTVYFEAPSSSWTPYCYAWNDTVSPKLENHGWPGVAMTKVKDNIYSFTFDKDYKKVIFNNNGSSQTADLTYPGANQIYKSSTSSWSTYDTASEKPVFAVSKASGTTFKADTVDVNVTVEFADSATYSIDGAAAISFSGSTKVTLGAGIAVDSSTSLTLTATNANGTTTQTYTYTKKAPSPVGDDGSTTPALGGKYATNPNAQVGSRKTITVDGSISDWTESMRIVQGVANDDPRTYYYGAGGATSMHEIAMDDYALYAAWDDTNLYLMWEMTNVSDVVAPEQDFPMSQGALSIYNMPIFIALSIDPNKAGTNATMTSKSLWDSGINFTTHIDTMIACSTNGSNGPYLYHVNDDNKFDYTAAIKAADIQLKWGKGILSNTIYGINKAYGSMGGRAIGDVYEETAEWSDFNTLGHASAKYDMNYEMAIPLSRLGIDSSYIEQNGIGIMKVTTFGTSGVNSLPHDPSMLDNADLPYSKDASTSHEKEDEDLITVPLARIGKTSASNPQPTTIAPVVTTAEPTTQPSEDYILGDANSDGVVSLKDATFIQKYMASLTSMTENQKLAADANRDGGVSLKDATTIQKYLAGLITVL